MVMGPGDHLPPPGPLTTGHHRCPDYTSEQVGHVLNKWEKLDLLSFMIVDLALSTLQMGL